MNIAIKITDEIFKRRNFIATIEMTIENIRKGTVFTPEQIKLISRENCLGCSDDTPADNC